MIRIRIDRSKCSGQGRCAMVAPEVFELDEDGFNATDGREVDEALKEKAQRGARSCPERAIEVVAQS